MKASVKTEAFIIISDVYACSRVFLLLAAVRRTMLSTSTAYSR